MRQQVRTAAAALNVNVIDCITANQVFKLVLVRNMILHLGCVSGGAFVRLVLCTDLRHGTRTSCCVPCHLHPKQQRQHHAGHGVLILKGGKQAKIKAKKKVSRTFDCIDKCGTCCIGDRMLLLCLPRSACTSSMLLSRFGKAS